MIGSSRTGAERATGALHLMWRRALRRRWPLLMTLVFVVVSMAYSFWWHPVVEHTSGWVVPGDVWSTFRAAHWVGWGALGSVYGSDTQLVTFPGIAVLLAPVAMLSGALGLSESISPVFLPDPTSWYLLGPAICILGSTCLFAFDAAAEQLGVPSRRRLVLCAVEAALIFQVVTIWGHPEDVLAVGLAVYALLAVHRRRVFSAGWLWGAAIVVQPLVLLMFPIALAETPRRNRMAFSALAATPSAALLAVPLISNWSSTSRVLLHQTNFPLLDHATPWVALAPRFSHISVGAGPGRALALLAAVALGVVVARQHPTLPVVLWYCAVALSLRCVFESVLVSFYLGPPLTLIVLVASSKRRAFFWAACGAAFATTVFAFQHRSPWAYWLPIVLLLGLGLWLCWPSVREVRGNDPVPTEPPPLATI